MFVCELKVFDKKRMNDNTADEEKEKKRKKRKEEEEEEKKKRESKSNIVHSSQRNDEPFSCIHSYQHYKVEQLQDLQEMMDLDQ